MTQSPLDSPNYTQIPNSILGDIAKGNIALPGLMAELEGSELKLLLAVCRLTFGYHQKRRRASVTMMAAMTGLSRQGVYTAASSLERRGLIGRQRDGGVIEWIAVVNSVDTDVQSFDKEEARSVQSFDTTVNSVDTDVQSFDTTVNSVDPHLRKKPETKSKKTGIEKGLPPNFEMKTKALTAYSKTTGLKLDETQAEAVVTLIDESPNFDLARWQRACVTTKLAGVLPANVSCRIETYKAGGDYQAMRDRKRNGNGVPDPVPPKPVSLDTSKRAAYLALQAEHERATAESQQRVGEIVARGITVAGLDVARAVRRNGKRGPDD